MYTVITRTRSRLGLLSMLAAASAVLALGACAPGAAPTAPTAQAVATQVVGAASPAAATVVAAASPVATAVAGASPAAATAVAGASPAVATVTAAAPGVVATAVAAVSPSPGASPGASGSTDIRLTGVQPSATDTTFSLQNSGSTAVDVSGWRLRVGSNTAMLPANTRLGPGETLTIHTATGTSSGRDVYLGASAATLMSGLQPGASVALLDAQDRVVSEITLPR